MADTYSDLLDTQPIDSYELPRGVYPDEDRFHLTKIKRRALRILDGLTIDELSEYDEDRIVLILIARRDYEDKFIAEIKAEGEIAAVVKETDILRFAMSHELVVSENREKINRWPEYFALLALTKFNHAVIMVNHIVFEDDKVVWDPIALKKHADSTFMDALEAVNEAENLYKKREKLRKANKASRKEQKKVKDKLIKYFEEHKNKYPHKTKLVRAFIDTLDDQEKGWFMKGNRERTLLDHIRKYQKNIT
ncbi:MAG: hypothetical protein AB2710_00010 [Candidatus Thiodiazotropha sp.]